MKTYSEHTGLNLINHIYKSPTGCITSRSISRSNDDFELLKKIYTDGCVVQMSMGELYWLYDSQALFSPSDLCVFLFTTKGLVFHVDDIEVFCDTVDIHLDDPETGKPCPKCHFKLYNISGDCDLHIKSLEIINVYLHYVSYSEFELYKTGNVKAELIPVAELDEDLKWLVE